MEQRVVQLEEMESVLLRLQCVHATLMMIYAQSFSKPLYCAADELMHVADEFSDFLEESAILDGGAGNA